MLRNSHTSQLRVLLPCPNQPLSVNRLIVKLLRLLKAGAEAAAEEPKSPVRSPPWCTSPRRYRDTSLMIHRHWRKSGMETFPTVAAYQPPATPPSTPNTPSITNKWSGATLSLPHQYTMNLFTEPSPISAWELTAASHLSLSPVHRPRRVGVQGFLCGPDLTPSALLGVRCHSAYFVEESKRHIYVGHSVFIQNGSKETHFRWFLVSKN
ncbi:hypothetical protein J6590_038680 [Homalodisca vitripennis]|nr:hypothetical protein J6590_038680 [Homalodisca vitripennis]